MKNETWQRLKNLSLFKLWVTDRQLKELWPIAALLATVIMLLTAAGYLFSR